MFVISFSIRNYSNKHIFFMKKLTYEKIVEKARKIHGNTYVYPCDMIDRKTKDGKYPIICKIHGEFWQTLGNHYKGCGCPKCAGNAKLNTKEYIEKIKRVINNDNITYEKVEYINNVTPIKLSCKLHGTFNIYPTSTHKGLMCPECQKQALSDKFRKTTEEFVAKVSEMFGNKYDYSKVNYIDANTKVCIICPKHGEFWKLPNHHLRGQGCPKCSQEHLWDKREKVTTKGFVQKAKEIHHDKYDYSQIKYVNSDTKIKIICKEHGAFYQLPYAHLNGQGCPICGKLKLRKEFQLTKEQFIEKARQMHWGKYDYSKVNYINYKTKVEIICPKHGSFWQTPSCHFKCNGYPTCKGEKSTSIQEKEVCNYIKSITKNVINENDRQVIKPFELDIYLPFENIAFEYDGLYWHQSNKTGKDYHLNKTKLCEENRIKLFHIFEGEWIYKNNIIKSKINEIFSFYSQVINANECEIKEIGQIASKVFIENNSLQNYEYFKYNYGLYYHNKTVSIMCFDKITEDVYEMKLFSNKLNTNVINASQKLFDFFISKNKPRKMIVYADRRWADYSLYEKLNFNKVSSTSPKRFYIINGKRINSSLLDKTVEETIYDCGTIKYELNIK